ncbi:hypothetical protein ABW19_dt0204700 [Dactylella cylindrospora]|nr:hypothetical protein ABW19_dt0204700 [Dactylella cylindrospora]
MDQSRPKYPEPTIIFREPVYNVRDDEVAPQDSYDTQAPGELKEKSKITSGNTSEPSKTTRKPPKRKAAKKPFEIHAARRKGMLGFLALGFILALGHHLYYHFLVGKAVGDGSAQQQTRL